MKGRLNSTVWWIAVVNVVLFLGAAWLMYSAGENAQGLSMWDAPSNGTAGGKILVALCLCGAAALFTVVRLDTKAITPVRNLVTFAERLAQGDYRARAAVESDDDFGCIAENLNRAAENSSRLLFNQEAQENLQKSVTEFRTTVSQIARGDLTLRGRVTNDGLGNVVDSVNSMLDNFVKVVERVRKGALDVQSSAKEILIASEEMSTGAIQQDQEITNTSSAVEELTVSMKQVSNNAEASAEVARRALDAAEQGNRSVRDTLDGMESIRSSVQTTAKRIKALGDRSLEISESVSVINGIAEQINLLALNAESEATRAGEAGKGFSIVAAEVRELAENFRKATKDIGALIKAIQAETSDAVVVSEEGTREVDVGAKLADQAGRALDAISTVVRQSAELAQEISLTSKQQVRGTEGVANAMQVISNITRQTSQGARQTARSVEQLVHMTEQLNEALSQFRVSAGPGEAQPELVNAVRR